MRIILLLSIFILSACAPKTETADKKDKPHVVATTGMLYDAVENIVGDRMTSEAIMGPGVDPHL